MRKYETSWKFLLERNELKDKRESVAKNRLQTVKSIINITNERNPKTEQQNIT